MIFSNELSKPFRAANFKLNSNYRRFLCLYILIKTPNYRTVSIKPYYIYNRTSSVIFERSHISKIRSLQNNASNILNYKIWYNNEVLHCIMIIFYLFPVDPYYNYYVIPILIQLPILIFRLKCRSKSPKPKIRFIQKKINLKFGFPLEAYMVVTFVERKTLRYLLCRARPLIKWSS